jgi:hypothetical protein
MASFAELCNDVYTITNRPDLIAETKLAVKQATLKMHQVDYFPKDLYETGISFTEPAFIQSLDYKALVPNWRTLKYLRKYPDSRPGDFFKLLSPDETLDRYAINKENVCYLAGEMLEIRSNTADATMLISAYVHPNITEPGYNSWIALEHPYAIVYEAAAQVIKAIGWDEQAAIAKQNMAEQLVLLKQNQLQAVGY